MKSGMVNVCLVTGMFLLAAVNARADGLVGDVAAAMREGQPLSTGVVDVTLSNFGPSVQLNQRVDLSNLPWIGDGRPDRDGAAWYEDDSVSVFEADFVLPKDFQSRQAGVLRVEIASPFSESGCAGTDPDGSYNRFLRLR